MSRWRPMHYILNSRGQPVRVKDVLVWAAWFETAERRVDFTVIARDIEVSTVFLGLDQGMWLYESGQRRPVLWETLPFHRPPGHEERRKRIIESIRNGGPYEADPIGDRLEGLMRRYTSLSAAKRGHHEVVAQIHAAFGITETQHEQTPHSEA